MSKPDFDELLRKFDDGSISRAEESLLESWYIYYTSESACEMTNEDLEHSVAALKISLELDAKPIITRLWLRKASIAAAVAVLTLGVWLYYFSTPSRHFDDRGDLLSYANDIAPGKNGATLTLADGKVLQLSDSKSGVVIGDDKLAYNDGSIIRSGQDGQDTQKEKSLIASTTQGQTYNFTLPDGTRVWLNADSKIEFASNIGKAAIRKIKLVGEGYFEVAKVTMKEQGFRSKEKRIRFIVESEGQEIEVLGTHFNINSYADEGVTRTTLLEGSVRVSSFASSSSRRQERALGHATSRDSSVPRNDGIVGECIILKPGQQSLVSKSNRIAVKEVDTNSEIDWKNGDFVFDGETLESLMRKISRWYNVEVEYVGEIPKDVLIGKVSRSKNISQVLKALGAIGIVHFKIEGRKVVVTR